MSVVKMELPSPFPRVEQKASLNPERIRCARETTGLSKVQLAESLGVTSRTVANYEEVERRCLRQRRWLMHCRSCHRSFPCLLVLR